MFYKNTIILSFIFTLTLLINVGSAQSQSSDITSHLSVYKVAGDSIAGEVASSTIIQMGDTLEYHLTYTNHSSGNISNLMPVLPVPRSMQYLPNTADPAIHAASLDSLGNDFQEPPIQRTSTSPSGDTLRQTVSPQRYRRLQWKVRSLTADQKATFSARVVVVNPGIYQ